MSKRPPRSGLHKSHRKTWGAIYDAARSSREEDEDVTESAVDPEDGAADPEDRAAVPDEGTVNAPKFSLAPLRSPLGTVPDLVGSD